MKEGSGSAEVTAQVARRCGAQRQARNLRTSDASPSSTCSSQEPANITKQMDYRTIVIHYEKSRYVSPGYGETALVVYEQEQRLKTPRSGLLSK